MIEYQLTVYMCSHCTRVHNAAQDCLRHELNEHADKVFNKSVSPVVVASSGDASVTYDEPDSAAVDADMLAEDDVIPVICDKQTAPAIALTQPKMDISDSTTQPDFLRINAIFDMPPARTNGSAPTMAPRKFPTTSHRTKATPFRYRTQDPPRSLPHIKPKPTPTANEQRENQPSKTFSTYTMSSPSKSRPSTTFGSAWSTKRCRYCHKMIKSFLFRSHEQSHEQFVNSKEAHQCDHCQKRFTNQYNKQQHIREVHLGDRPHQCPHCPHSSARLSNMQIHIRNVHKISKDELVPDSGASA